MNLYIYSYNNYYNRQVKKAGDSVNDYADYLHYGPVQGVYGFTPGDGINTTQVIGSNAQMYDGKGNYLIAENAGEIDSRWFIVDVSRDRTGQWTLTLHRDLIVDYYDIVVNSPVFVEKATLNYNDPFIFNSENMSVNQIKTSETLLKDKSGCAWLVGYLDKNTESTEIAETKVLLEENPNVYKTLETPIESSSIWQYCDNNQNSVYYSGPLNSCEYLIKVWVSGIFDLYIRTYSTDWKTGAITWAQVYAQDKGTTIQDTGGIIPTRTGLEKAYKKTGLNTLSSMLSANNVNYHSSADLNSDILNLVGKTIQDDNGKIFSVSLSATTTFNKTQDITAGNLFNKLSEIVQNTDSLSGTPNIHSFKVKYQTTGYKLHLTDISNQQGVKIDVVEGRIKTLDAPWDIFAIPYGKVKLIQYPSTILIGETSEDIAIKTATAMQKQLGSKIYDLQLLPYCPIPNAIQEEGTIAVQNNNEFSLINYLVDGETTKNLSAIFYVNTSKFNTIIEKNIENGATNIEKKLNNECDKWRLTAPNYSNYFDFSVEKNEGVEIFDVDCEYKPYTPYIHINPNFKGLYGYDDNGPRGLVLGGDFSLSQIIDQWQQYQIQNKNFQAIFDRQIQNMEVKNDISRTQDIVSAIAGTAQGTASGALAGATMSPAGAVAGAIIGGVSSAVGGVADILINEKLRNETLDYTKDLFGYQLGNIQALPNTISKISAYNNNNKIFPILEYYTCTEKEKKAFLNKVAWNGMTVMRIGTLSEFIYNTWRKDDITSKGYIKGKLIRLELPIEIEKEHAEREIHGEDYHVINALSGELNKGVYIL